MDFNELRAATIIATFDDARAEKYRFSFDRNYRDCPALQPDVTFSIQMIDK